MRLAGLPYRAIADKLGYSSLAAASKDVTRALQMASKAQQESSEELLQIEIDRLDRMMASLWTKACGGDVKAVEGVERLIARRCALLGLDLINRNGAENSDVVSLLGNLFAQIQATNGQVALPAAIDIEDAEVVEAVEVLR
ncbi:hypothetical protein [Nonomuraea sp. NPDC005650]|uniref:hypothetical protein n=1 Tax=Nonomuraea sp. NPDC005650 TaxID=3157045 RepID=UPI0033AA800C